ncbi:MAG TPA: decarboxylating 6-phosphogluconate dehydrogenase [Anaerolineales bacterium]
MELAMIGLGKMGLNMATRLVRGGHRVIGNARSESSVQAAIKNGAEGARSLEEVVKMLKPPRVVWTMVPAGQITDDTIQKLSNLLSRGDVVIDGGNSNYKDSIRHAALLESKGIEFLDSGTSGGVWGISEGYSLMIGGNAEVVEKMRPIFETLAPAADKGWGRVGPHGAGHFVKMIHNGIEYGMMQALAEGFNIMKAKKEFDLNLDEIAEIWRYGSVVRSWLLDLTARALKDDPTLSDIQPWVEDSGEGRWTVAEAIDHDIPAPIITLALQMRFVSRDDENFSARLLSAMRNQFGGHAVKKTD